MHQDLEETLGVIRQATAGMAIAEMSRHPEGKWSTAGIVEHLDKTFSSTAQLLMRCVEEGAPRVRPDTWIERLSAWVVIDLGYFPSGRQAPDFVRPEGRPAEQTLEAIGRSLDALDAACAMAEQRFGPETKVANHPMLGRFSVRQWRGFHLAHARHHAKQIQKLRLR